MVYFNQNERYMNVAATLYVVRRWTYKGWRFQALAADQFWVAADRFSLKSLLKNLISSPE